MKDNEKASLKQVIDGLYIGDVDSSSVNLPLHRSSTLESQQPPQESDIQRSELRITGAVQLIRGPRSQIPQLLLGRQREPDNPRRSGCQPEPV
jgi:hypothetical protein